MGFFGKKKSKKNEPEYLSQDITELDETFTSLYDALNSELTLGSEDWKETIYTSGENKYVMIHKEAKVYYFVHDNYVFNLSDRIKYNSLNDFVVTDADDDYDNYVQVKNNNPQHSELLRKVYSDVTLMQLFKFDTDFDGETNFRATTTMITDPERDEQLELLDYFGYELEYVVSELNNEKVLLAETLETLDLSNPDEFQNYSLYSMMGDDVVETLTAQEKFLHELAENDGTVDKIIDCGDGFRVSELFHSLRLLVDSGEMKIIDVNDPQNDIATDEAPENNDEELNYDIIDEPVVDGYVTIDEHMFNFDDETFENDNENANLDVYTSKETPISRTENINDDIRSDVLNYLNSLDFDNEMIDVVLSLMDENFELEREVLSIEEDIATATENYNNDASEFRDLKIEKDIEILSDDLKDLNESNRDVDDDSFGLYVKRDDTNKSFFMLSDLEEERHKINQKRLELLNQVMSIIPYSDDDFGVNGRVQAKIDGINNVVNKAYYEVSKTFTDDNDFTNGFIDEDVIINGINITEGYIELDNTPTFQRLVDEFGFNPIKEFIAKHTNEDIVEDVSEGA